MVESHIECTHRLGACAAGAGARPAFFTSLVRAIRLSALRSQLLNAIASLGTNVGNACNASVHLLTWRWPHGVTVCGMYTG